MPTSSPRQKPSIQKSTYHTRSRGRTTTENLKALVLSRGPRSSVLINQSNCNCRSLALHGNTKQARVANPCVIGQWPAAGERWNGSITLLSGRALNEQAEQCCVLRPAECSYCPVIMLDAVFTSSKIPEWSKDSLPLLSASISRRSRLCTTECAHRCSLSQVASSRQLKVIPEGYQSVVDVSWSSSNAMTIPEQ
ncbi:hypothetical protein VTK26DRAFT_3388 [Humicola hyalothermophila]